MERDRRNGILIIMLGLVLLEVLGNIFIESVGAYSYYFLPLPLAGTFLVFRGRKKKTIQYRRFMGLSMILVMLHFIFSLAIALLYNYYFIYTQNFTGALNTIYVGGGISVLLFASVLVTSMAGTCHGNLWKYCALLALMAGLVVTSVVLVDGPSKKMMDDITNIGDDHLLSENLKASRVEETVNEYNLSTEKYMSGLALALAGTISTIVLIGTQRKTLKTIFVRKGPMGKK